MLFLWNHYANYYGIVEVERAIVQTKAKLFETASDAMI